MATISVGQAVLQKVVAKLGGVDDASEHLELRPSIVNLYLEGMLPVPDAILLRAVDVVLEGIEQGLAEDSQPFNRRQQ